MISGGGDFWGIFKDFVDFGFDGKTGLRIRFKFRMSTLLMWAHHMARKNVGLMRLDFEIFRVKIFGSLGVRVKAEPVRSPFVPDTPNCAEILRYQDT